MKKVIEEKEIEKLVHFTRASNLISIYKYGLLTRKSIEERGINCSINDFERYDGCKNATSMSIEFPNYKMFYQLRCENPGVDWVVLSLPAELLYECDCVFCTANAGSTEMFTMPLEARKGKKAFLKLFEDLPNGKSRVELGIQGSSWYPTNPQAEVLLFEDLPAAYIQKVYFENNEVMEKYIDMIPEMNACVSCRFFSYRHDWRNW